MAYIGRQNLGGAYRQLDDISSGFDGSDTTHTMQVNSQNVTVGDVNQIILSLGGVIQKPGTDFTVSGSVLTFTTAPAANTSFFAVLLGSDNGGTGTPTDASVTVSKLAIAGGEVKLDADGDTSITADTDDQIDFKAGGTDIFQLTATTATFNDGVTITTADNTDTLTLISTDADGSGGPILDIYRNSASPADDDTIGKIVYRGRNDNSQDVDYGMIEANIVDASDGTEDGNIIFRCMNGGALNQMLKITGPETVFNDASIDTDFRVETNGAAYALFVDGGNDVVMFGGTGSGSSTSTARSVAYASGHFYQFVATNSTTDIQRFYNADTGSEIGSIEGASSSTAFRTSSDYRLKENVDYDWDATTRLKQLKPARFNWIADDTNTPVDGFLAHEVSSIVPEAVGGEKDAVDDNDKIIPQGIDQSKLVPLMVKTIQELEARIKTLEDA